MPNTTTGVNRVSVVGALPTGSGMNGALHSNTNLITLFNSGLLCNVTKFYFFTYNCKKIVVLLNFYLIFVGY
jgi:hypothetical protein